ncbi:DUF6233 domain-containing protein [Streptomyces sp. NPDC002092]
MRQQRIDDKTDALRQREAEQEQGHQRRPPAPDWIVELGTGAGNPPTRVHTGDCYAAAKRRRPGTLALYRLPKAQAPARTDAQ